MSFGSFIIFLFILYLFFVVGRSIWINYNSNKDLDVQAAHIVDLQSGIKEMQYRINYYQTNSYREKEAREKLAYVAPGENVIALPVDKAEDRVVDKELGDVVVKTPNYQYWWKYFFR